MKNTLKNVWSVWDTTDKLVATLSILGIIFLCLTCSSCNAQPSNIPTMEYNDASTEVFDYDGAILLYPDGIIDFVYHTQDNEYVIEYDDPDAFDPDNMTYNQDSDYYYIEIYCDSILFFEYLTYYNSLSGNKNPEFFDASEEYFIEEDYLEDGTPYYKLVKYATKKNL